MIDHKKMRIYAVHRPFRGDPRVVSATVVVRGKTVRVDKGEEDFDSAVGFRRVLPKGDVHTTPQSAALSYLAKQKAMVEIATHRLQEAESREREAALLVLDVTS